MDLSGLPRIFNAFFSNKVSKLANIFQPKDGILPYKWRENLENARKRFYLTAALVDLVLIVAVLAAAYNPTMNLISPLISPINPLTQAEAKNTKEIFGFAPHWTLDRLDNVDFNVLTTLAYFDLPIKSNGEIDTNSAGYKKYHSNEATQLFKKAHSHGTRVVATVTQLDNATIKRFLDNDAAQTRAIELSVKEVKDRGIDGANIDFEYIGDPGDGYRQKFSKFVTDFTTSMHKEIPGSRVTVSVYASAATSPKLYDLGHIGNTTDGVFMMAYDFAVTGADQAMPTAPLYGHKNGTYWYDISTAVDDFLTQMPADKLILGLPWYGYNYAVHQPGVKASTNKGYYVSYKKGKKTLKRYVSIPSHAQTYSLVMENITPDKPGYQEGWDAEGQVGYKAYYSEKDGSYRMIFQEDERSLAVKYQFIKDKNLAGVGMWALGFDTGNDELWNQLEKEFGQKRVALNIND